VLLGEPAAELHARLVDVLAAHLGSGKKLHLFR
jgi:hypothetical protein